MNWNQLHHWFWYFPYQFCTITIFTRMPHMSDAFYFSVDFWCNLVCIRKRRKYIPVQFPISHPVIGYLHHLKRYWSFTITRGMWWVISYIWIQFNVTEGKTSQELRKLTYTSYLESQVRMSVLSFLVQTGCLSCPWPPCPPYLWRPWWPRRL